MTIPNLNMDHSDDKIKLVGAVVCGGNSSRMGTDKAALPCPAGGTNLSISIARLAAICNTIVVAGRERIPETLFDFKLVDFKLVDFNNIASSQEPPRKIFAIADAEPEIGPLAGVLSALRYAKRNDYDGVLVTPVDMPYLTTADLRGLRELHRQDSEVPAVAISENDKIQPLVAIYPVSTLNAMEQLLETSHRSLYRWLQLQPHHTKRLSPKSATNMNSPKDLDPIDRLAQQLSHVPTETVPLSAATGRILHAPIIADRDSPAADVSAMDGYAIVMSDAVFGKCLNVDGISRPGFAPPSFPGSGFAVQIFTGSVVPDQCELVVKREDVEEQCDGEPHQGGEETQVRKIVLGDISYSSGMNIRKRGENSESGKIVIGAGTQLHAGHVAAAANFGYSQLQVARQLRVRILVTGDELRATDETVQPWQLRDSNGPTLLSILSGEPQICVVSVQRAPDDYQALVGQVRDSLSSCDALLLTGGVSMGDFDFVPRATLEAGAVQIFHKLPIRPGKPIFGAVGPAGQLVLGLPGNPVSAAVGAVRFAKPLLRKMAGCQAWLPAKPLIHLQQAGDKTLPLTWFRLVQFAVDGQCIPTRSLGSGDLVSMSQSAGFVEVPPQQTGVGPWPFWSWKD